MKHRSICLSSRQSVQISPCKEGTAATTDEQSEQTDDCVERYFHIVVIVFVIVMARFPTSYSYLA